MKSLTLPLMLSLALVTSLALVACGGNPSSQTILTDLSNATCQWNQMCSDDPSSFDFAGCQAAGGPAPSVNVSCSKSELDTCVHDIENSPCGDSPNPDSCAVCENPGS